MIVYNVTRKLCITLLCDVINAKLNDIKNAKYEGVSKSSCTNAISFFMAQDTIPNICHMLNQYVSSLSAKF